MGYYRKKENDDKFNKIQLESFDELPPEMYKELVERSLAIAQRLKSRSVKLHELLAEQVGIGNSDDTMEHAYWRTSCVEQLAFFEMQISNIHKVLENEITD